LPKSRKFGENVILTAEVGIMSKSLRLDFYVVLGIIFVSVPIILHFQVRPLTSAFFFFVIPTIYLYPDFCQLSTLTMPPLML
jgi:hypothetical protein